MSSLLARPPSRTLSRPNDVAQELTGRAYISHSAITTYQQCPLRYMFRYIEGLPEETVSASLVFGSALHSMLEHHFRQLLYGGGVPSADELYAAYEGAWQLRKREEIRFSQTDDRASLDELARRLITTFLSNPLATPAGPILGIEEELTGELIPGVPDLLARIDLLVDAGDELILTDFKSAKSRWSDAQVSDAAGQLLLYYELVKPLADGRPIRLEFAVLTKTKTPEITRHTVIPSPRRIARTKAVIERVWAGINARLFYPAPSPLSCPSCPFRRQCDAWPA